jgi:curved DNA-binding protein CbpA
MNQDQPKQETQTSTPINYYDVLNLKRNANQREIERAYIKLSLQCHPNQKDGNKEMDETKFAHVCEAYQALIDPEKRKKYDEFISNSKDSKVSTGNKVKAEKSFNRMTPFERRFVSPFSFRFHPLSPFEDLFGILPINPLQHFDYFMNHGLFDDDDLEFYGWRNRAWRDFGSYNDDFFGQKEVQNFMKSGKPGKIEMSKNLHKRTKVENGVRTTITEMTKVNPDGTVDKEIKEEVEDEKGHKTVRYLDELPDSNNKHIEEKKA